MIKTYKFDDTTQITPNFNAKEFRCKCDKVHEFSIPNELVDKLEKLYATLNCSKIIVTSGFRCVAHDKNVGDSGVLDSIRSAMRRIPVATVRTDSLSVQKLSVKRHRILVLQVLRTSLSPTSTRTLMFVKALNCMVMKFTATAL